MCNNQRSQALVRMIWECKPSTTYLSIQLLFKLIYATTYGVLHWCCILLQAQTTYIYHQPLAQWVCGPRVADVSLPGLGSARGVGLL